MQEVSVKYDVIFQESVTAKEDVDFKATMTEFLRCKLKALAKRILEASGETASDTRPLKTSSYLRSGSLQINIKRLVNVLILQKAIATSEQICWRPFEGQFTS